MKKALPLCVLFLLLAFYAFPSLACTSFAVYRDHTLYGMNFDYPDVPVRYSIDQYAAFEVAFEYNGNYVPISGMNEDGLFMAVQMLYPEKVDSAAGGRTDLQTFAASVVSRFYSMEQVHAALCNQLLANRYVSLHCMLADKSGSAAVLEPGTEQNRVTQNPGDYLVMTNFSNADAYNPDTQRMEGVDCERYIAADAYIEQNKDSFDIEDGLETLKRTIQTEGGYPTQTSMVYDPVNGEIYIAVRGDFERIWKISLAQRTIESYRGFERPILLKLDEEGVTAQELVALASAPPSQENPPIETSEEPAGVATSQPAALPVNPSPGQAAPLGLLSIVGICLAALCIIMIVWLLLSRRIRR